MKFVHLYDYLPSKDWMNYSNNVSAPRPYDRVIAHNSEFDPDPDEKFILVKDNIESDKFLRTYLRLCNPHKNFCSHILFMQHRESLKSFFLTDAVMNIDPTPSEIMRITLNAADFCRKYFHPTDLDYMVHVNLLTNSGHFSLNNPTSSKMELLLHLYRRQQPVGPADPPADTGRLFFSLGRVRRRTDERRFLCGDARTVRPDHRVLWTGPVYHPLQQHPGGRVRKCVCRKIRVGLLRQPREPGDASCRIRTRDQSRLCQHDEPFRARLPETART